MNNKKLKYYYISFALQLLAIIYTVYHILRLKEYDAGAPAELLYSNNIRVMTDLWWALSFVFIFSLIGMISLFKYARESKTGE